MILSGVILVAVGFFLRAVSAYATEQPIRVLFAKDPPIRLASFLDYANIPYDVQTSFSVDDVVGNYSTVVVAGGGGNQLSDTMEQTIKTLVNEQGVGLVYCGYTANSPSGYDPAIVSIFNVTTAEYVTSATPSATINVTDTSHFITQGYTRQTRLLDLYAGAMGNITNYTQNGAYPKFLGTHSGSSYPALIANEYGQGRAVWFNYRCDDNLNIFRQGYSIGAFLNALIWTSGPIVGQHFAFSTIPTYFTMRVDDVQGNYEPMFAIAEEHDLKLSSFLFLREVASSGDRLNVIKEYYTKNHSMGVHAADQFNLYFFNDGGLTDPELTENFDEIRDYFSAWGLRQPTTFVPHQYKLAASVFPKLDERGLHFYYGDCSGTTDGPGVVTGEPFGDTTGNHLDVLTSLSNQIWCFRVSPRAESLTQAGLSQAIDDDKASIEWAIRNVTPIILYSHEANWANKSNAYLQSWLDGLTSYLDSKIPGWSSLAGEFLAPMIVQHKNISVDSALYDDVAQRYRITVSGTNTVPVPVTIYEPENQIAGWDGIQEIVRNGDFYHLFIPSGSGSRTYTVDLASGTPSNGFAYISKADTLVEGTSKSGLGLKVDLFDFGTLSLTGSGGHVATGTTTIKPDGTFTGSASIPDGEEQYALVPLTIMPSVASVSATIETWQSDGERYKKWTETSSAAENTAAHVVGDLAPGQTYEVKVDGDNYATDTADDTGQLSFNYQGGYSTHTFEVLAAAPVTMSTSAPSANTPALESCSVTPPKSEPPELYAAIPQGAGRIELYFTASSKPYDHYALEYGTRPGAYQFGAESIGGQGTRTYTVNGLSLAKLYYFRVRAGNGCAAGPWSNELSASTLSTASSTPLQTEIVEWDVVPPEQSSGESAEETRRGGSAEMRRYRLAVTVLGQAGQALADATLTLHSRPQTAVTDEQGRARFTDIEAGEHTLDITYRGQTAEQKLYLTGDDAQTFEVTIRLESGNPFARPSVIIVLGALGLLIVALLVFLVRAKRFTGFSKPPRQALASLRRRIALLRR